MASTTTAARRMDTHISGQNPSSPPPVGSSACSWYSLATYILQGPQSRRRLCPSTELERDDYCLCVLNLLHTAHNRRAAPGCAGPPPQQRQGLHHRARFAALGRQLPTQLDPMRVPSLFSGGVIQSLCFTAESEGTWGHRGF